MSINGKNTYRITWEHKAGRIATTAEINVDEQEDVIMEYIHLLAKFRGIFWDGSPVAKIIDIVQIPKE